MIIDQLFTRPIFEAAAMASPEQLAYNKLRAQWDSYQTMTGGGGNTAVSRDPAHAAKLATIPAEIAKMAAALKAKGIDAEAQYDALSGPAAAPVDANQAYGGVAEVAPPGAKAERMVKHIKQGYAKDGKLTPKEKGIAFATAWKAHNAGRVEEGEYQDDYEDEETELCNGCYVRDKEDSSGEIFVMRGDPGDRRVRIEDRHGRGWNIAPYRLTVVDDSDPDIAAYFGDQLDEAGVTEAAQGHTIEAHGVRGMDRRTWHKTFRNTDQMIAWAEKHDAEIIGTRDLEQARHHNLSPAKAKGVAEGLLDRFINTNNTKDKKISIGDYTLEIQTKNDKLFVYVTTAGEDAFDVAEAEFNIKLNNHGKKYLESEFTKVYPKYQRKGIATMIYRYVKSLGYDVQPSSTQTDSGKSMWKGFRDKGVAEGSLNELSKDTLKSYAKKAVPDMQASQNKSKAEYSKATSAKDDETANKHYDAAKQAKDRTEKRMAGVAGAIKRFNKEGVAEGEIEQTKTGIRHRGHRYGSGEELPNGGGNRSGFPNPGKYARDLDHLDKNLTSKLDHSMGVTWPHGNKKRDMDESIDPLMLKLKQAMVQEGRVKELADDLKTMPDADFMKKYGKAKAAIRKDMKRVNEAPVNELSTNKLAQYKTAAAKDASAADKAGDVKRGDKRFHGMVQATKKQFDNDAKKIDESRAARRALMARIVNSR